MNIYAFKHNIQVCVIKKKHCKVLRKTKIKLRTYGCIKTRQVIKQHVLLFIITLHQGSLFIKTTDPNQQTCLPAAWENCTLTQEYPYGEELL